MHDIFISYSHKDAQIADAICHKFEEAGIRCWYAPRNIKPGDEWADAIIKALEQCKAMVLVFTEASNLSTQVRREVDSAVSFGKTIIPFKCTNTEPTGSMRYYLSTLHWMDALTAPMDASIEHLLKFTKGVLKIEEDVDSEEEEDFSSDETGREPGGSGSSGTGGSGDKKPGFDSKKLVWILAAACVILAVVAISAISGKNKNTASSAESTPVVTESAASQAESVTQEPGSAEESTESAAQEQSAAAESSDADSMEEMADSAEDSSSTASESSPAGSANAGEANGGSQNQPAYTYDENNDSPGAENYLYTVQYNNTEVRLDRYFGPEDEIMVIPEIIDGLPVTSIGEKCFEDHTYIKKLVLPETLEAIYYRAFYGCNNLAEMNIPASLTHLGGWSFAHCGFVNVIFPDTFDALDYGAFYGCNNLETVVLPAAVDWFGENTFRMCPKLISVTMPAENPEINAKAFEPDTDVTIIGIPGSYTEKYAKGMGLKFEAYTGG